MSLRYLQRYHLPLLRKSESLFNAWNYHWVLMDWVYWDIVKAFSGFTYVMSYLGLSTQGRNPSRDEFRKKVIQFCKTPWSNVSLNYLKGPFPLSIYVSFQFGLSERKTLKQKRNALIVYLIVRRYEYFLTHLRKLCLIRFNCQWEWKLRVGVQKFYFTNYLFVYYR